MTTQTMVKPVLRNELKYYLSNTACLELEQRLRHVLSQDAHNQNRFGYMVRSLYFDSITDECLFEKQSGIKDRQKYRLRVYDPGTDRVKFEIKHKVNQMVYKETATIDRATAELFINGEFEKIDVPVLFLENENTFAAGQALTRVQAFLEMLEPVEYIIEDGILPEEIDAFGDQEEKSNE